MAAELLPEIWVNIFEHLRRPLPNPHSDLGPVRSIIRQPDLLSTIKVSKRWYDLAATKLYKVVITDNLELFLYCGETQILGISSKSTLLGRVEGLFIEYAKKDGILPRQRDSVVRKVFKGMKGDSPGRWDPPRLGWGVQLYAEARMLGRATKALRTRGGESVLKGLKGLSVGALYGLDEEAAQAQSRLLQVWPGYAKTYESATAAFGRFINSTPSIKHYCQCPRYAPLNYDSSYFSPSKSSIAQIPTMCFHYHLPIYKHPRFVFGFPAQFYVHKLQWHGETPTLVTARFAGGVSYAREDRSMVLDMPGFNPAGINMDINRTVYRSFPAPTEDWISSAGMDPMFSSSPTTEAEKADWRKMTSIIQSLVGDFINGEGGLKQMLDKLPESVKVKDQVLIKPLFDAEPCQACGWAYEG